VTPQVTSKMPKARSTLATGAAASADPIRATVVSGHLEQILDNLLANAVEASPPGCGIEVGISKGKGTVTMHVRDHGPGLSDQERQRVRSKTQAE
jgi:signal transduction histidine kinase